MPGNAKRIHCSTLGRWAESIEACDTALGIDPSDYASVMYKGRAWSNSVVPKEGIACFDAALRIQPDGFTAHEEKGLRLASPVAITTGRSVL